MWKTFRIYYQHRVSLTSGMFLISVQIFWSGKLIQQTVSVSLFSQWRSRARCGRSAPGGRHPGCATVSSVKSFVSYCHWYDHFISSTMWRWNYVWADISFLQTATFNSKWTKITNPANPDYNIIIFIVTYIPLFVEAWLWSPVSFPFHGSIFNAAYIVRCIIHNRMHNIQCIIA